MTNINTLRTKYIADIHLSYVVCQVMKQPDDRGAGGKKSLRAVALDELYDKYCHRAGVGARMSAEVEAELTKHIQQTEMKKDILQHKLNDVSMSNYHVSF